MTLTQRIITIAICVLGTMATRFLPFLIFSENKETPPYIKYLGKALPSAIFGMLVVYCLRGVQLTSAPFGIPELLCCGLVVALHLWKGNTLLSILGGTVVYMVLVQTVF